MTRFAPVVLAFTLLCGASCKKSKDTTNAPSGGSVLGGGLSSTDDALARNWIKSLNDYSEVIENKGTGDQRRAASAKWQETVKAIQALPQDRINGIKNKYKDEIAAAEARFKKAQESRERGRPD